MILQRLPVGRVEQVVQVFEHLSLALRTSVHGILHVMGRLPAASASERLGEALAGARGWYSVQNLAKFLQGAVTSAS